MITRPSTRTITTLGQLAKSPHGEELLKVLDSELETIKNALLDAPDGQRYLRLQGRGKAIQEILDLLRKAPEAVDKTRAAG